jgi:hypothetical protein
MLRRWKRACLLVAGPCLAAACAQPKSDTAGHVAGDQQPAQPPPTSAVLTWHNDTYRTGAQLAETVLTPAAVATKGLHVRVRRWVDAPIYSQILYVPGLDLPGGKKNVFYASTVGNTVFAYDADDASGSDTQAGLVWKTTFTDPEPEVRPYARGIYSTPVIDLAAGVMYVVFATMTERVEPDGESPTYQVAFWLAALDIRTGAIERTQRIEAQAQRADGSMLQFVGDEHRQRPGLLLVGGSIYLAFGTRSKESLIDYHGWVLGYDAATFALRGAFCTTVNEERAPDAEVGEGGGIWMSGAGPAADDDGNVYVMTGNARADASQGSYGDAVVKLGPGLQVAASFTPSDPLRHLELNDVDLGSGGPLVLPGTQHVLGGGKTGIYYLLDRAALAETQELDAFHNVYDPGFVVDSDWEGGPHIHGTPLWWRGDRDAGTVYHWSEEDYLKGYRYSMAGGQLDAAHPIVGTVPSVEGIMPGGQLALSANGNQGGSAIVWALVARSDQKDPVYGDYPVRFIAFDAETLDLLYEDDSVPTLPKWMGPTIADGKVFVPTKSKRVLVYELNP